MYDGYSDYIIITWIEIKKTNKLSCFCMLKPLTKDLIWIIIYLKASRTYFYKNNVTFDRRILSFISEK